MPYGSDDFLLRAYGIAPLPVTPGRLRRWITRMNHRLMAADARHRDLERLRSMPDYLLRDIGLTRDDIR